MSIILENSWNNVINDYQAEDIHLKFLTDCIKSHKLDFAVTKYKDLIEIDSNNSKAHQMLTKVQNLALSHLNFESNKKTSDWWFYPSVYLLISIVVTILGMLIPIGGELISLVGFFLVFVSIINFHFRKKLI